MGIIDACTGPGLMRPRTTHPWFLSSILLLCLQRGQALMKDFDEPFTFNVVRCISIPWGLPERWITSPTQSANQWQFVYPGDWIIITKFAVIKDSTNINRWVFTGLAFFCRESEVFVWFCFIMFNWNWNGCWLRVKFLVGSQIKNVAFPVLGQRKVTFPSLEGQMSSVVLFELWQWLQTLQNSFVIVLKITWTSGNSSMKNYILGISFGWILRFLQPSWPHTQHMKNTHIPHVFPLQFTWKQHERSNKAAVYLENWIVALFATFLSDLPCSLPPRMSCPCLLKGLPSL